MSSNCRHLQHEEIGVPWMRAILRTRRDRHWVIKLKTRKTYGIQRREQVVDQYLVIVKGLKIPFPKKRLTQMYNWTGHQAIWEKQQSRSVQTSQKVWRRHSWSHYSQSALACALLCRWEALKETRKQTVPHRNRQPAGRFICKEIWLHLMSSAILVSVFNDTFFFVKPVLTDGMC